ncbi:putative transcription factor bzip protein [Botrytis fragariae]|uniref:Putative transcription factor bzip protein n=1 Tax=Botrytis fragariae TaxID=1964551 RepID=A0A8H6EEA4_9HELO|nr:putative transcription factor bzip protein [Botrytis fragariae]KAF5868740.1 putative transcription factor bzip protein [Botrytis fragariae]
MYPTKSRSLDVSWSDLYLFHLTSHPLEGALVQNKSMEAIMSSRLRSRLSRILGSDKEEGTMYEKINDAEKEIQSDRNDETKKNTHQSSRKRNRSVDSLERRRSCLLNLMRHNPRNDNLPAYSFTQTSCPSSSSRLPDQ